MVHKKVHLSVYLSTKTLTNALSVTLFEQLTWLFIHIYVYLKTLITILTVPSLK